jgi:hypothetical protein
VPPPLPPALPPEVVEPPAPPARPDPTEPLPLQSSGDTPPVVKLDPSAIGWEDDDVETQIYADQDAGAKPKPPPRPGMSSHRLPLQPPAASSPAVSLASASLVVGEPVHAAPLRSAAPPVPPPASGWERPAPTEFPGGSNELTPSQAPPPRFDLHDSSAAPLPAQREISAPSRLVSAVHPVTPPGLDPLASFGARIAGGRRSPGARRVPRTIALGGAVAVVVVAVLWILRGEPSPAPPLAPKLIVADASTGFDLYVVPTGILSWKLDGESRTERLPSRIRGIAAGAHTIEIEPPPGFVRQVQRVDVEQGKAPKVEIKLPPDKASDKVPDKVNDKPASPGPAAASPGATRPLGVLVLGSKPPCEIYVDGNSSGLRTPQQDLTLPIGRHRITLVNAEFKIRESFPVDITAGAPVKLVKDYSDRLPR